MVTGAAPEPICKGGTTLRERRRHPRIYQPIEVHYHHGHRSRTDRTVSLSMGGLYIRTDRPLEVGSTFDFAFRLPDLDHPFRVTGEVIWKKFFPDTHGPPGMGVRFLDASEEDRQALLRFLAHSQITRRGY